MSLPDVIRESVCYVIQRREAGSTAPVRALLVEQDPERYQVLADNWADGGRDKWRAAYAEYAESC